MAVTVALLGIVVVAAAAACSKDDVIDRVTIVNRTPFDFEVDVSDAAKQSWQLLGHVQHDSSDPNELVRDVGPTWVFRFRYGGRTVGELTVDREELRRDRWRLEVPSSVADRMRELGFKPPWDE